MWRLLPGAIPNANSGIIVLLAALLGGGLIAAGLQVYLRWRKGPIDDALQIQQATDIARKASQELFVEYRVELEEAKRRLEVYLDRLLKVNRELGAAEERIRRLEEKLASSNEDVVELRGQLRVALAERDGLEQEITKLHDRLAKVERRVD